MKRTLTTDTIAAPQGSAEWLLARAGVFTASNFHLAMQLLADGEFSAAAHKEARKLAFERATGTLLDDTPLRTRYTERGHELEDAARRRHAELIDVLEIDQCGLIRSSDGKFGASVDGLIDSDGGAEYKAFTDADKVMKVLTEGCTDTVIAQVQGGMLLTGRDWWHFGLYHPALAALGRDLNIIEIERDDNYIERLWEALLRFDALIERYKTLLLDHPPAALKYPRDFAITLAAAQPVEPLSQQPQIQF